MTPPSPSLSTLEDYHVGQILQLRALHENVSTIGARIRKLHFPWTVSCGMVVDVLRENEPETTAFLKLFDRRFAHVLGYSHGISAWTKEKEEVYIGSVRTGVAHKLFHDLRTDDSEHWDWDDTQNSSTAGASCSNT